MWPFVAPCKMFGHCVIDDDRASTTCRPTANEEGREAGRLAPDWEEGDGAVVINLGGKEPSLPLTFESVCRTFYRL